IAIGNNSAAVEDDAVVLGANAVAGARNAVALGQGSANFRADTVSVGSSELQRQITNVAAGTEDTDAVNKAQLDEVAATVDGAVANAVQYDDADKDSITLAGADGTTIDNLADGRIGSGSQQAINGGQLYGSLDSVAAILGGGATVTAIGTISAPTYTVQGGDYFSVADALGALDASLTDFGDRLTVVEGGGSTGGNGADKRIAIGGQDSATIDSGTNAVAVGSDAGAKGENGTALGGGAHAAGRNDTAVGGNAWVGAD